MSLRRIIAGSIVAAFTLGLAGPAAANDKDKREVSAYVLTEAGLGKFVQATRNLAAVPGACVRGNDDEGPDNETLDQLAARLNAIPGAKAALQSAGMNSREYVVFMFSMMESGLSSWAVAQTGKLPPGVQQANVDFYKKHEAQMAAIGDEDPCGDEDEDSGE